MKKHFTAAFLCFCYLSSALAQAQWANYWPLDLGVALDFSGGQPQVVNACALQSFEASGAICNDQGQLQLYSNGGGRSSPFEPKGAIYHKNHGVMYDMGHTEGGGYSAKQGAVVIPAPGKPRHYYVLTMEEAEFTASGDVPGQPFGRGFSAFLVDMDANGGLGGVVQYLPMMHTPSYEGLCAIQHPNCRDYWVIISDQNTGDLMVFPVTPQGIGGPRRFNFSTPSNPIFTNGAEIRASPDARHVQAGRYLFGFNAVSGELTQVRVLNHDITYWEFSPGSRYIYWQRSLEIVRMNIQAPDPNITFEVVVDLGNQGLGDRGALQLGPDGSIWFRTRATNFTQDYMNAIRNPDDVNAFVETKVLTLPPGSSTPLVPDFPAQWFATTPPQTPQVQLGPDLSLCGDSLLFIPSGIEGYPMVWNTGDTTATLIVDRPGTYIATVLGCNTTSDTLEVLENSCTCLLKIPNAFTPNGDQFNDTFGPNNAPEGYSMRIWNRWGQQVFSENGTGLARWDGTINGQPAPSDVYVYQMIWASCGITEQGEVTLLR